MTCIFCSLAQAHPGDIFHIPDKFPVSPGHTLVIPKKHFETWFDAPLDLRTELLKEIDKVKLELDKKYHPQGYNIGINCGEVAGQSIPHLHVHLIPRYAKDVADPTGGVRGVVPDKANYKSQSEK